MQAIWLLRGFIHANVPPFVLQLPLPCSSAFPLLSIATDAFFCSSLLQTLRLRPPFALPSFPLLLKHDECEVHTDMPRGLPTVCLPTWAGSTAAGKKNNACGLCTARSKSQGDAGYDPLVVFVYPQNLSPFLGSSLKAQHHRSHRV